jgi:prepilin-type processing-associated H-X9-DG protein
LSRINESPWKSFGQTERDRLIREGFNTNYTQSWYMAYTEMKAAHRQSIDFLSNTKTLGPLNARHLANVDPSKVPLMADGRADTLAGEDLINYEGDRYPTAKHLTDGPSVPNTARQFVWQDYSDWGPGHGKGSLSLGFDKGHDKVVGNIAFADGHVQSFRDLDNDKEFAPARDGNRFKIPAECRDLGDDVFGGLLTSGRYWWGRE